MRRLKPDEVEKTRDLLAAGRILDAQKFMLERLTSDEPAAEAEPRVKRRRCPWRR